MKRKVLIFYFISCSLLGFSQKFVVEDIDGNRIPNVSFSNNKINISSDSLGIVDLSGFKKTDTISTSHIAFLTFKFVIDQVYSKKITLSLKTHGLKEITISRSLNIENKKTKTIKLESKKILSSLTNNPADLLSKSTAITIQKSQSGGGSPNIRGFEANRILLIVDGVKLNNAIYRSGHLQSILSVDNYIIDNLSVLHGPSSIFYGSGGLGGAIIINTIDPGKMNKNKSLFIQQYETSSASVMSHYHSSYQLRRLSLLSSISIKQYGNTKMGKNRLHGYEDWGIYEFATNGEEQLFGEYNQVDLSQKISLSLNKYSTISSNSQFSTTSNIHRFDKLNDLDEGSPKYRSWYYGPQQRILQSINYTSFFESKLFDKYNISFSYQNLEESRNTQLFIDDYLIKRNEQINIFDTRFEFDKSFKDLTFKYGISNRHESLVSSAYTENKNSTIRGYANTRYPDNGSTTFNFSVFLLSEYLITNKLKWFAGFRSDYNKINCSFSEENPFSFEEKNVINENLNYSFSSNALFEINQKNFISLSFSNAFRNPNIDDLGKVFSKNSGTVVVPNKNLDPEKITSYELLFSNSFGLSNFEISIFYSKVKGMIEKRSFAFNGSDSIMYDGEMMKTIASQNIKKATLSGLNFQFKHALFRNLNLFLSGSFVRGVSADSLPLSHVPPFSLRGEINYLIGKSSKLSIYSNYNGWKKSEYFDLNGVDNLEEATDDGIPSWYTINLLFSKKFKTLVFSIACENILDIHYKTFGSGISANGRNFILNLQKNW